MSNTIQLTEQEVFDIYDPANIQEPFPFYKRLRSQYPVYWSEKYAHWLVTRYRDVKMIFQASQKFSSGPGDTLGPLREKLPARSQANFDIGIRFTYSQIQSMDPPRHTEHRQAAMKAFMPLVNGMIKSSIERRVNELLDAMEDAGSCDFMEEFAYPLPSQVIFDLVGIPEEHHQLIRETSELLVKFSPAIVLGDCATIDLFAERAQQSGEAITELIRQRRNKPQEDMLSALISEESGMPFTDEEIVMLCIFLLMAGHETTANLLGGSMRYLLADRRQWDLLQAQPELLPGAVEELLRFVSPVLWMSRIATEDFELDGHILRKGSEVYIGVGSSNHDPDEFENPEVLDVARKNPHSIAFGHGIHTCLGAALARMEAQVALSTLLRRMPKIELRTNEFDYRDVFFLRSLKSLHVAVNG